MPRRLALFVAEALLGACPAVAFAPHAAELTASVRTAIDRGELLYIYDQAAWQGTEDILAQFPNLLAQAGGYVVTGDQLRTEVVFFDQLKVRAVYRASFSNGKLLASGPPFGEHLGLTPLEVQMITAKEKANDAFLAADVELCSRETPNLTALPPERPGGPIIVYLMTPQSDMQIFPLGGHFSTEVLPNGTTGKVRRFMNTCFDMSLRANPNKGKPAAFVVTHLLDPTPTEIHVFTSIASKVPIIVMTNPDGQMWSVDGNRVAMQGPTKK